jgi:uncharacterized protein (DUF58 family)
MLTPDELRQLRRISLQAGRRVDSLFAGGYRSAFRGTGMEFEEVRPYVPGDDVRHIDWNVTARASVPHVKEFREERELTLILAVDASGSMAFGSGPADKRLLRARLAGGLAVAAGRSQDRVGLLLFSDRIHSWTPPSRKRGHAWRVVRQVYEAPGGQLGTDLGGACDHLGRILRRRAVIVLVSDFLDASPWIDRLGALAARHTVHGLVVSDRAEQKPGRIGLIRVRDAETGRIRLVDGKRLKLRLPAQRRVEMLRERGAYASTVDTRDDPFRALMRHFRRVQR